MGLLHCVRNDSFLVSVAARRREIFFIYLVPVNPDTFANGVTRHLRHPELAEGSLETYSTDEIRL